MGQPLAVDSHRSCILLPYILLHASFPFFVLSKIAVSSCKLLSSWLGPWLYSLSFMSSLWDQYYPGGCWDGKGISNLFSEKNHFLHRDFTESVLQSISSQCDMMIQNCEVLFWLILGSLQYFAGGWELSVSPFLTHYQIVGYSENKFYHTHQDLLASMHKNNLRICLVILMWSQVSVHFIVSASSYMITRDRCYIILEVMS